MEQNNIELSVQEIYLIYRENGFSSAEIKEFCKGVGESLVAQRERKMMDKDNTLLREMEDLYKSYLKNEELYYMAHLDYVTGDCPDKSLMN